MENKQTAVEYLWDSITEILPYSVDSQTAIKLYDALKQAKQIERVQIIEAYADGSNDRLNNIINQQYYKDTFGKGGENV